MNAVFKARAMGKGDGNLVHWGVSAYINAGSYIPNVTWTYSLTIPKGNF